MKINKISPQDNKYLQIVTHIAKKPKSLYYIGTLPEKRLPSVAIVGTRKPTNYGKEVTTRIAEELAKRGVVIISGLALGIDGIAHQAALSQGGTTVAVLANGLPTIYPATHRQLAENILASNGAIISEYEPGKSARPHTFLERNRIVSGLADAIIITEAASRSGTLNTAMHALEQGKEVFVVPGNITSPMSSGCNALLQQGATPLLEPQDILDTIMPGSASQQTTLALGSTPEETAILQLLQNGVRDGEQLQKQSDIAPARLSTILTMLEINGAIRSLGANQWTIR